MCMRVCDRAVVTSANGPGVGGENPLILNLPRASLSGLPSTIFIGTLPGRHRDLHFLGKGAEAHFKTLVQSHTVDAGKVQTHIQDYRVPHLQSLLSKTLLPSTVTESFLVKPSSVEPSVKSDGRATRFALHQA